MKNRRSNIVKLLLIQIAICFSNAFFAQGNKGIISGTIIENNSKKNVGFATVSIYYKTDSTLVTGCISDSSGKFELNKIKETDYYLNIDALGYQKKSIVAHFEPNTHLLELGKIAINIEAKLLEEIVINDEKNNIQLKSDRKIINVENSIAATGGSAVDVLQILPEFKAEQGNVTLKNQSFTVLLDGRPSGITPEQLLQFPASSIESIEVITNPSVKYNPQGLGGIVNLKLKKNINGINSVIQASGGSDNCYNGAATINYRIRKFNFFASANGNYYGGQSDGYLNREIFNKSQLNETFLNQQNFSRYNFKVGFDFDLDSTNLLTFYWFQPNDNGSFTNEINSTETNIEQTTKYNADISSQTKFQENQLALSYNHLFPREDTKFTVDIMQILNNNTNTYQPYLEYTLPSVSQIKYSLSPNESVKSTDIQCNLILPIGSKINFESGINTTFTSDKNKNSGENYNFANQSWSDSIAIKNTFDYNQLVAGGYLLITTSFEKISFQIGGRGEYTKTSCLLENSNETSNFEYFNFFPSANISFTASKTLDLSLSFSRRIQRPESFTLNPFIYQGDYLSEQYRGNPYLKPAFTNSYEFNISNNWNKFSFNATLSYAQGNDIIDNVFYLTDDIKTKTWSNVSNVFDYMFNSSINWKPKKWFRLDLSGNFIREDMKGLDTDLSYKHYDFRFITRYNLNNGFIMYLNMLYYAPSYYLSSKVDSQFRISLSFKKNISEKFIISFRLNNILNSKYISYDWNDSYTSKSYTDSHYRAVYLGIMYKFGKEIKTRTKLNTNDIKMQRD